MKKQLFLTLLTLSINILPGQAAAQNSSLGINSKLLRGRWCLNFSQTGLLCFDL